VVEGGIVFGFGLPDDLAGFLFALMEPQQFPMSATGQGICDWLMQERLILLMVDWQYV
jgi:hypothetical protein